MYSLKDLHLLTVDYVQQLPRLLSVIIIIILIIIIIIIIILIISWIIPRYKVKAMEGSWHQFIFRRGSINWQCHFVSTCKLPYSRLTRSAEKLPPYCRPMGTTGGMGLGSVGIILSPWNNDRPTCVGSSVESAVIGPGFYSRSDKHNRRYTLKRIVNQSVAYSTRRSLHVRIIYTLSTRVSPSPRDCHFPSDCIELSPRGCFLGLGRS